MTAEVQESIEVLELRVSVSSADRGGTVEGSNPVQPTPLRLARGTSLALEGRVVGVAGTHPSDSLITGDSHFSGWR